MATTPAQKARPTDDRPRFWLRRGDQLFVGTLLSIGLVLVFVNWVRLSEWVRKTVEVDRLTAGHYQYAVDVNSATWVEWAQFEGIGETLAKRIVADRESRGPFGSVEDVARVKGIGPKKLAQMRPYLTVEPAQATASSGHAGP
jgi:competence protein ComEA